MRGTAGGRCRRGGRRNCAGPCGGRPCQALCARGGAARLYPDERAQPCGHSPAGTPWLFPGDFGARDEPCRAARSRQRQPYRAGGVRARRAVHEHVWPVLYERLSGRAQRQPRAVCRPVPPAVFGRAAPARRRFSPQLKRPFPPGQPARPARGRHCQCKNRGAPARPGICGGRGGRMRGRARGAAL